MDISTRYEQGIQNTQLYFNLYQPEKAQPTTSHLKTEEAAPFPFCVGMECASPCFIGALLAENRAF